MSCCFNRKLSATVNNPGLFTYGRVCYTPSVDHNSSSPFLYELDSDVASVQSDVLEFTVHILVEAIEGNICAFRPAYQEDKEAHPFRYSSPKQ